MAMDDVLERPNGANQLWADLAVKTPASPDFKAGSEADFTSGKIDKAVIEQMVQSASEKNLKLIGFADFNLGLVERGAWMDDLVKAFSQRQISCYPGLRLMLAEGVDLVALFEPTVPQSELDVFLAGLGLGPDQRFFRNNKPVPIDLAPREVIARIRQRKGMVLVVFNDALLEHPAVVQDPWVWGVIVPGDTKALTPADLAFLSGKTSGFERKLPLAKLQVSFASRPSDIGSAPVSVKLGEPNLEGLRIALLDSRDKVRFPDQVREHSYSRLISAQWQGGFLDGLAIHFNRGFNAMIGGRGTGKTTIIETLRFALDEKPKTNRNLDNNEQILRDVFMPGSKLSLIVESHEPTPKRYLIERIYPFDPVVRDAETGTKLEVNPKDVFRAEIFGNKEIYEISKQQDFQVNLLERLCEKELAALREQEEMIIERLSTQTYNIAELTKEVNKRDEELAKLPAAEEKLTRFLEMDIPAKIEEKRKFEQESHTFERGASVLAEIKKILLGIITDTTSRLSSLQDESAAPLHPELLSDYTNNLVEFVGNFERNVQELIASLQSTEEKHDTYYQQWQTLYKEGEERFQESLRSLQDRYPGVDVNEFIQLEKEVMRLRERKVERDSVAAKLSMRTEERRQMVTELNELRSSAFEMLAKRVSGWNTELGAKIRIQLNPKGDADKLVSELRSFIPSLTREQATQVVTDEKFSFPELVHKYRQDDRDGLRQLLKLAPSSLIPSFNEETLCRIETVYVPPRVGIQLNLGTADAPSYRDVNHLSDGQRCTAILGILLLESAYPLIVDQPEEDLDNAFIVEEIAERFRSEMDKRQFLVATHNANIPVLGDAAQILALEADVEHSYLREGRYGYIDSPVIKEVVENILEGGRQAFEIRKQKYGL